MRPLETVKPTPEQFTLIRREPSTVEIIRGAAGSGKTTSAILKLQYLLNYFIGNYEAQGKQTPVNALVLTFNRTLKAYVEELAESQNETEGQANIEVSYFAKWACKYTGYFDFFPELKHDAFISQNKQDINLDSNFLKDEIEYLSGRFMPEDYSRYYSVDRKGRGNTPQVTESIRKKIVGQIVEPLRQHRADLQQMDWSDLAVRACRTVQRDYDIIIIDEAQDFTANQFRVVANALKKESCLVCVIDTAQRIYARGHTWVECGIDMRGAAYFRLTRNYRNTKRIARLAHDIMHEVAIDDDGSLPDIDHCDTEGEMPLLICGRFAAQMDYVANYISENVRKGENVGILFKSVKLKGYKLMMKALDGYAIEYDEISGRSEWPESDANVVFSTLHSAKGLEFDHVIMPGLAKRFFHNSGKADHENTIRDKRLLVMAVGRARKQVILGYKEGEQISLIDELDSGLYIKEMI